MREEILRLEGIDCKQYGVSLIEDLRITLRKGETMGLLIKNAHRRSSIVSLLCGHLMIESGRVYYNDQLVDLSDYTALCRRRVAFVGGRSELIDSLSVAENIFIIRPHTRMYLIRKHKLNQQAERLFERFHTRIKPGMPISRLTMLERMLVQLMKAYASGARIVVLNDLSRTLGTLEIDTLMKCVDILKEEGVGVFLADAYWDVLSKHTDRLSVFSSRSVVKVFRKEDYNEKALSVLLEEPMQQLVDDRPPTNATPVLTLHSVCTGTLKDITLTVRPGEIVSILDIDGSGVDQIASVLTGDSALQQGEIWIAGKRYKPHSEAQAFKNGIGLIGDNPTHTSLFRDLSVMDNLSLPISNRIHSFYFKKRYIRSLKTHCGTYFSQEILENQTLHLLKEDILQRIVYVRWRLMRPRVLVVIRPLAATDSVGSRITRDLLLDIARSGSALVVLSANPTEAHQLGHRVLVLREGRLSESPGVPFKN